MITIIVRGLSQIDIKLNWTIGEPIPNICIYNISEIHIEGEELLYVRQLFNYSHLIPKGKKVIIYGDLAKTIVANLNNDFNNEHYTE